MPPHPAVISRKKQKNKKHRRRPITPKEMNKITTVSFLHTVHTQILKPSGQESFSILIYKRKKKNQKNTKTFITWKRKRVFGHLQLWQYRLWSFQTGDTKLERFLPKNQHTQRKLLNFEFWINGELSKSAKIWLSKSIFYVKNHSNLSQFLFHKRILI